MRQAFSRQPEDLGGLLAESGGDGGGAAAAELAAAAVFSTPRSDLRKKRGVGGRSAMQAEQEKQGEPVVELQPAGGAAEKEQGASAPKAEAHGGVAGAAFSRLLRLLWSRPAGLVIAGLLLWILVLQVRCRTLCPHCRTAPRDPRPCPGSARQVVYTFRGVRSGAEHPPCCKGTVQSQGQQIAELQVSYGSGASLPCRCAAECAVEDAAALPSRTLSAPPL